MLIVAIGGPAYAIGVGGGAASSMRQGQSTSELDFNSVQRGNGEMGNKACRVIRACVEMGDENPIESVHDQGAGGPSNVLTELMEAVGGKVDIRKVVLGDKTMSVLAIWSAE
jgi:phosphoribosylformylglycinamidine synthase